MFIEQRTIKLGNTNLIVKVRSLSNCNEIPSWSYNLHFYANKSEAIIHCLCDMLFKCYTYKLKFKVIEENTMIGFKIGFADTISGTSSQQQLTALYLCDCNISEAGMKLYLVNSHWCSFIFLTVA